MMCMDVVVCMMMWKKFVYFHIHALFRKIRGELVYVMITIKREEGEILLPIIDDNDNVYESWLFQKLQIWRQKSEEFKKK